MDKLTDVSLLGGRRCAVCHFRLGVDAAAHVRDDGDRDETRFTGLWEMQTSAYAGCRSCHDLLDFFYGQIEACEGFSDTQELGLIWDAYQPARAWLGFSSRRDSPGMCLPESPRFELIAPGQFLTGTYHQTLHSSKPFQTFCFRKAC